MTGRRRGNKPGAKQHLDRKQELQVCLIQAIITGEKDAAKEALVVLNKYFESSTSGPGILDFTCKQIKDSKNDGKVNFEGKHKKFMTYSPLMAAVELGEIDMAESLLSNESTTAAFRNKVR